MVMNYKDLCLLQGRQSGRGARFGAEGHGHRLPGQHPEAPHGDRVRQDIPPAEAHHRGGVPETRGHCCRHWGWCQ